MPKSSKADSDRVEALELDLVLIVGRLEQLEGRYLAAREALSDAYAMIACLQGQLAAKQKERAVIPTRPIQIQ